MRTNGTIAQRCSIEYVQFVPKKAHEVDTNVSGSVALFLNEVLKFAATGFVNCKQK
jgi:hypothetical protein